MRRHLVTLAPTALLVAIASAAGGSGPGSRLAVLGLGVAALLVAAAAGRLELPRSSWPVVGSLAALAAVTLASALWATDPETAFDAGLRTTGYVAALGATACLLQRGDEPAIVDALAIAAGVVAVLALGSEVAPGVLDPGALARELPAVSSRLSYPVQYWNGLGLLLATGLPALVAALCRPGGTALRRGAALAGFGATIVALGLTSSRGAALAGALGLVALALLDGRPAAALRARTRSTTRRAAVVLLLAGCALAVVAADPSARWDRFTAPPGASADASRPGFVADHLINGGGSGRWQFWSAATDAFRESPAAGQGAGGYEAWWAARGSLPDKVRSAHSLPLQTLAELGLAGAAALLAFVLAAVVLGAQRLRDRRGDPWAGAALTAVPLVVLVGSAVDWSWDLPAVALPALLALGALAAAAAPVVPPRRRTAGRGAALVLVAALGAATVASGVPFLARSALAESRDAVRRGDGETALRRALAARTIQPWASGPRVQEALVRERLGDPAGAVRAVRSALARDRDDWRLELLAARLLTKTGDGQGALRSLARARALAPRYPIVAVATAP